MNPLFTWTIAEEVARTTREMLTRRCARRGGRQVVLKEALSETVPCGGCAAPLRSLKKGGAS
jgi:hypothetical protein